MTAISSIVNDENFILIEYSILIDISIFVTLNQFLVYKIELFKSNSRAVIKPHTKLERTLLLFKPFKI